MQHAHELINIVLLNQCFFDKTIKYLFTQTYPAIMYIERQTFVHIVAWSCCFMAL